MPSGLSEDVLGGCRRRHDGDMALMAGELAQDVALDAVVDGDDVKFGVFQFAVAFAPLPRRFIPGEALAARHHRHEIHAEQARPFLRLALERIEIECAGRLVRDHCVGHAVLADQRGERTGVEAGESDDAARFQPGIKMPRGAIVRRLGNGGMQDHASRAGRRRKVHRLDVVLVGADIADVRKGKGDDLPGIGWIGEDLLIAGHRGVETDFADGVTDGAEADTFQHRAVGHD
jgi:hypothetical protein